MCTKIHVNTRSYIYINKYKMNTINNNIINNCNTLQVFQMICGEFRRNF